MANNGIFLDLDGTLLQTDKQISQRTKDIIQKFVDKDDIVILETGKSFASSYHWHRELDLDTPLVTSQGQVISYYDREKDIFDHHIQPLDISNLSHLLVDNFITGKIINIVVDCFDTVYMDHEFGNLYDLISEKHVKIKTLNYQKLIQLKNVVGCYVELSPTESDRIKDTVKTLNKIFKDQYKFAFWMTDGSLPIINIKPAFVDKWRAVEVAEKLYDINRIISFGNGYNDKTMLEGAHIGFAMKNSARAIKKSGNNITKFDNNNDGVAIALEKLYNALYRTSFKKEKIKYRRIQK